MKQPISFRISKWIWVEIIHCSKYGYCPPRLQSPCGSRVPLRLFGTSILDGCSSYCEGQSLADQAKELLGHTGLNSPRGLQGNVFFWMRNQLLIKIAEPFRRNP